MRRSIDVRLDRLDHALAKPDSGIYVQYVGVDDDQLARLSPADAARLGALTDQINTHVRELIDRYGPDIERDHPLKNDGLDALNIADLETLGVLLGFEEETS
jgi:hypothetical protein